MDSSPLGPPKKSATSDEQGSGGVWPDTSSPLGDWGGRPPRPSQPVIIQAPMPNSSFPTAPSIQVEANENFSLAPRS